ncbi:hypothetical protein HDU96_006691 [Phlyctochytrium bullatum]|nr:hypothetical protein HDU96_006691 [Phlyctochytrium bullatum]
MTVKASHPVTPEEGRSKEPILQSCWRALLIQLEPIVQALPWQVVVLGCGWGFRWLLDFVAVKDAGPNQLERAALGGLATFIGGSMHAASSLYYLKHGWPWFWMEIWVCLVPVLAANAAVVYAMSKTAWRWTRLFVLFTFLLSSAVLSLLRVCVFKELWRPPGATFRQEVFALAIVTPFSIMYISLSAQMWPNLAFQIAVNLVFAVINLVALEVLSRTVNVDELTKAGRATTMDVLSHRKVLLSTGTLASIKMMRFVEANRWAETKYWSTCAFQVIMERLLPRIVYMFMKINLDRQKRVAPGAGTEVNSEDDACTIAIEEENGPGDRPPPLPPPTPTVEPMDVPDSATGLKEENRPRRTSISLTAGGNRLPPITRRPTVSFATDPSLLPKTTGDGENDASAPRKPSVSPSSNATESEGSPRKPSVAPSHTTGSPPSRKPSVSISLSPVASLRKSSVSPSLNTEGGASVAPLRRKSVHLKQMVRRAIDILYERYSISRNDHAVASYISTVVATISVVINEESVPTGPDGTKVDVVDIIQVGVAFLVAEVIVEAAFTGLEVGQGIPVGRNPRWPVFRVISGAGMAFLFIMGTYAGLNHLYAVGPADSGEPVRARRGGFQWAVETVGRTAAVQVASAVAAVPFAVASAAVAYSLIRLMDALAVRSARLDQAERGSVSFLVYLVFANAFAAFSSTFLKLSWTGLARHSVSVVAFLAIEALVLVAIARIPGTARWSRVAVLLGAIPSMIVQSYFRVILVEESHLEQVTAQLGGRRVAAILSLMKTYFFLIIATPFSFFLVASAAQFWRNLGFQLSANIIFLAINIYFLESTMRVIDTEELCSGGRATPEEVISNRKIAASATVLGALKLMRFMFAKDWDRQVESMNATDVDVTKDANRDDKSDFGMWQLQASVVLGEDEAAIRSKANEEIRTVKPASLAPSQDHPETSEVYLLAVRHHRGPASENHLLAAKHHPAPVHKLASTSAISFSPDIVDQYSRSELRDEANLSGRYLATSRYALAMSDAMLVKSVISEMRGQKDMGSKVKTLVDTAVDIMYQRYSLNRNDHAFASYLSTMVAAAAAYFVQRTIELGTAELGLQNFDRSQLKDIMIVGCTYLACEFALEWVFSIIEAVRGIPVGGVPHVYRTFRVASIVTFCIGFFLAAYSGVNHIFDND